MTSYSPATLVDVAEELDALSNPRQEHYDRTILNRCYYAPYGVVRQRLEQLDNNLFGKAGQHNALVVAFQNTGDPHLERIGIRLNHLKAEREMADYEFSTPIHHDQVKTALDRAPTVIDKVSKLSSRQWKKLLSEATKVFSKPKRRSP